VQEAAKAEAPPKASKAKTPKIVPISEGASPQA
jgi:hypothetical protein